MNNDKFQDPCVMKGIYEVLTWLESIEDTTEYIYDGMIDIQSMKIDFLSQYDKFIIIRRGMSFIIQNKDNEKVVARFAYTEYDEEDIYQKVLDICHMLNDGSLIMLENLNNNIVDNIPDIEPSIDNKSVLVLTVVDDDMNVINDAKVVIDDMYEKYTDELGRVMFSEIGYGIHTLLFSKENYKVLTIYINVDSQVFNGEYVLVKNDS